MQVQFSNFGANHLAESVVILVGSDLSLRPSYKQLDQDFNNVISTLLKSGGAFTGRFGQTKGIAVNDQGRSIYIILAGLGDAKDLEPYKFAELGGHIFSRVSRCLKLKSAAVKVDFDIKGFDHAKVASWIAAGAKLASYRFDKYFTKKKPEELAALEVFALELDDHKNAEHLYEAQNAVIEGVFLARDCVNEPPNFLYPDSYAKIIADDLGDVGVEVEVFGENEMRHFGKGMGALLGVGQGSTRESKLVVMQYNGGAKGEAPVAFVGKGVTFDTGGISLKPSSGMAEMKYDMAGSAAVVGLMKALALRGAKVNAVGVVGLVENMPGGNAQRPSDVVTTMSGQTIEVLDTDAEGRLVLADALWYTQDRFKPQAMINLATLTGAIVVALGSTYAGCFTNNDALAEKLIQSGAKVNEKLWRMPLHKDYDDQIKSDIADMANLGNVRGSAGSATAAQLLQRFVNDVPWAHLDIAGMAWEKKGAPICPKGATAFGVRLLSQFIKDHYEGA
jgi:leucyl aminopeptidase